MNKYFRRRQRNTLIAILVCVATFVAIVYALSACHNLPPVYLPPAPTDGPFDGCNAACANLERLHCPESKPNAKGMTCPQVCQHAERLRDMNTVCVATAGDLDDLQECGSVRCMW